MEEKGILELKESSVIADDIEKKIRTVGVRGLDFEKAKEVLLKLIAQDSRILNDPAEPFIVLGEMGASSIDIIVRVWCNQADYWGIKFDLNQKVYETFPKEGLEFPFQTFTVNVTKE